MTQEQKLLRFRRWALAVLDLLGAEPDRQLAYLEREGVEVEELLFQFDDLLHVAKARVADGSLRHEDYLLLQAVDGEIDSVKSGIESFWVKKALKEAAEWAKVRSASRVAKQSLEQSWNTTLLKP